MKNFVKFSVMPLVFAGILFGVTRPALAGTITQTFSYAMLPTEWDYTNNIAKINLAIGGVLNDVKITETVAWRAYLAGTNTDASSSVTVVREQAELQLFDSITGDITPVFIKDIGYQNNTGITISPKSGHVFGDYYSTNNASYHYTNQIDTAEFTGIGVLPFEVSTYTANNESTSGGSGWQHTQYAYAGLNVQVIYNYSGNLIVPPVPEPSAGILLGIGSLICWGWRRKITSKHAKNI